MKRLFNTLMLLTLGCIFTFAAENHLYISDFKIVPGQQKTVEIVLDNETPISSLQFDLVLPDGLTYVDNSLAKVTSRITRSSHTVMAAKQTDCVRFGVLSAATDPAKSAIKGNSGAILTIDVKADANFTGDFIEIVEIIGSNATVAEPVRVDMNGWVTNVSVDPGHAGVEEAAVEVRPNEPALLNVTLANNIDIVGLQATVTIPEGVSFTEGVDGEYVTYTGRLSDNVIANLEPVPGKPNTWTLLVSSLTNDVFEGTDGVLLGLNIVADGTVASGDVVINDIKVVNPTGVEYTLDDVLTYNVKCITDPTGDGVVDIDDVYAVSSVIKGLDTNPYTDINGDGVVDIDDVYALIAIMKE